MLLAILLWFVVLLFPLSEIVLAILRRAKPTAARVEDRGSMRLLWLVIVASVILAIGFQWVPVLRLPIPAMVRQVLALGLIIAGLAIRWISILTLGRLFTVNVAIHHDHALVDTGLYRHIRHPSYTGLLVAFVGLGVFFGNWPGIIVIVVPVTLAVLSRVAKEERALHNALGASYAAYCARTKRLIPGLL